MTNRPMDPNALKALEEMKMEVANEQGISDTFTNTNELDPVTNIFTAGLVGGLMTRKLVEMGQRELMNKK